MKSTLPEPDIADDKPHSANEGRSLPNENFLSSDWAGERGKKWKGAQAGMDRMLAPLDEPLIHALRLDGPISIADVGCGGGGTSRKLLQFSPPGSSIQGFDISADAIESARTCTEESNITFAIMDVAKNRPPKQFDRLISRFGIMFFEDPGRAFRNLLGFLTPGGRFAFAVWGKREENQWMTSVRRIVGSLVDIPPSDPDGPGPFRYGHSEKLTALLETAGFEQISVEEWRGALPVGGEPLSASEAAHFALTSFSSFSELLARAGASQFDSAHEALTACFLEHHRNGAVWMNAHVNIVTGARPM